MRLSELLNEHNVVISLEAEDKTSIISALVDIVADNEALVDRERVRDAVFEREKLMSTGVGKGLALPHAKTSGVRKTLAALALLMNPIDFDAPDGQPVSIVFLLVGPPDSKSIHVRILSRISRLMNRQDVRESILSSESKSELLTRIDQFESQLIPN